MYVLAGNLHNNKIENHFGYCRGMAGSNRHMDISSFLYCEQGYLVKHIYQYCRNADNSHNRLNFNKLFNKVKNEVRLLTEDRKNEMLHQFDYLTKYNKSAIPRSLQDKNIFYVAGYVLQK